MRKCMKQLSLLDFNIKNVNANRTIFSEKNTVDYVATGRKQHLFHLITSGKRTYFINGETFEIFANQILFIPDGTHYRTEAHSVNGKECSGIGIVFDFIFENDCDITIPQNIFSIPCDTKTKELFERINLICNCHPVKLTKLKSLMLDLISHLASDNDSKMQMILKPALDSFADTYKENLPIKFYAEKCNLSESYFRKVFRETIGMSPINYRNELRFAEAERLYLLHRNIGRAATEVGFCDEVFFTKLYKKRFGISIKNIAKLV